VAIASLIASMAAINLVLRLTPIALLSRARIPKPLMRWLSFIPISVMGTLVATEVLRPGGTWQQPLANPGVYAAALAMLAFWKTRSFLGATLAGMASFVFLRLLMA
jgi:branched-subunit amino acid transport protein